MQRFEEAARELIANSANLDALVHSEGGIDALHPDHKEDFLALLKRFEEWALPG